jgi:hypothetical protein
MTIIEIINTPIILQIVIWVLLGLWIVERVDFEKDGSRIWAVIFSPYKKCDNSEIINYNELK